MEVIFLSRSYDGGTGRFINSFVTHRYLFRNINFNFFVLNQPKHSLVKLKEINSFWKSNFGDNYYSISLSLVWKLVQEIVWMRKCLRAKKYDILVAVDLHAYFVLLMASFMTKRRPIILTLHNNISMVIKHKVPIYLRLLLKLVLPFVLRQCQGIVVLTERQANQIKQDYHFLSTLKVIPYGLGRNETSKKNKRHVFDKNSPRLLSMGRLVNQKDFSTIIEAYALVKKRLPQAALWIVGDGPLKRSLISLVRSKNIEGIRFIDWADDVSIYLDNADMFLFASHWEGLGWSILEAVAHGLPVISTDTPFGPREILHNGKYGLLVPMTNPYLMSKAVTRVIANHAKYSQKSRIRAGHYLEESMLQSYQRLFHNMADKNAKN